MAKKKTKFEIKDWYYLAGPLSLVAFFLMDVIGGFNYPGYDWSGQVIQDLLSLNSRSFPFALVFCIIYFLLTVFAAYCIYMFFKNKKLNKLLSRGIKIFLIGAIVGALSLAVFYQPESGTYAKVKDQGIIAMKDEVVDSESDTQETQEVFDADATMENLATVGEMVAHPLIIGNIALTFASLVLSIIAFIFMIIGGFKKQGKLFFAAVSIFCLILVLYSIVSFLVMDTSIMGLNSRFASYSIVLFMAFLGSYIYITDIKE